MQFDLAKLLDSMPPPADFLGPLMIYGAGNTGRAVARYLAARGIQVTGFLDASSNDGQTCEGLPVSQLGRWLATSNPESYCLLVAIHNRGVSMVPLLASLRQLGFRHVLTMIDFTNTFSEDQPFRFWLVPSRFYVDQQKNVDALLSLLADESSHNWARSILRFRVTGDYAALPEPSRQDQYFPTDLPRWPEPLRFVDCGAYDGDTVAALLAQGYSLDAVAAFEPDLDNFAKVARRFPDLNALNVPCGVSARTTLHRFSAGGGEASRIDASGDSVIQCVALDDAIPAFAPNLVKMDTEGAEIEALQGAEQLVRRYKPNLAISLYHLPSHIWEIPLLIRGWDLDYKFYIRGHAHSSFDSVLYAVR